MAEDTTDLFSRASANVGSRIRKLREQRRLTLKKLSAELGYSGAHISNVELGKTELSFGELKKLALFFQGHPLELIAGLPPEACKVVDEILALTPDRRLAAVCLFHATTEMAAAMTMWQTRSTK